jgi:hypothetical protein
MRKPFDLLSRKNKNDGIFNLLEIVCSVFFASHQAFVSSSLLYNYIDRTCYRSLMRSQDSRQLYTSVRLKPSVLFDRIRPPSAPSLLYHHHHPNANIRLIIPVYQHQTLLWSPFPPLSFTFCTPKEGAHSPKLPKQTYPHYRYQDGQTSSILLFFFSIL